MAYIHDIIARAEKKINDAVSAIKVHVIDSSGSSVQPATSTAQTDGSQKTQIVETLPTDSTKLNPSQVITPVTVGDVTTTTIVKTINGVNYVKTIEKNNLTGVVTISVWS